MATPPEEGREHFVDQHEEELIYRLGNVESILSQLLQDNLLVSEECEAVRGKETRQERIRQLFSVTRGWSQSHKDKFYRVLRSSNSAVMSNMERELEQEVERCKAQYKENVKSRFGRTKDRNARMGESAPLRKRFTRLLLVREPRGEEEKRRELSSSGAEHARLMAEARSPTTLEELFEPDGSGAAPVAVVLHGPAGIGKSLAAHKLVLDWATAGLYAAKFEFLFYLSYKDFRAAPASISLPGLLAMTGRVPYPAGAARQILARPEKLGFLLNGFEELKWAAEGGGACRDPFRESPKEALLRALLTGRLLRGASFLVTCRPVALATLRAWLPGPRRFVEVLGYAAESRERYLRAFFGAGPAERAAGIARGNEVLFTLCAVPLMCWVVATVTKQAIAKHPSDFPTDTSMFLYYLKGLIKYHSRDGGALACVGKVCALANEGVLSGRVLFDEGDLERHGLRASAAESVFLDVHVFRGGRTRYSFVHGSFQQFLAALHYALPEGSAERAADGAYLPEICKGRCLAELLEEQPHLALPVRFLFGLLNQEQNRDFSKSSGCRVALQDTTAAAMATWLLRGEAPELDAERVRFLYETRDDGFTRRAAARAADLTFRSPRRRTDDWAHQLAFCLKACTGRKVTLCGYALDREGLALLVPLLKECPQVCFRSCRFADDVHSPSGWKGSVFASLLGRDSNIEELFLLGCILPSFTCEVLDKSSKQSRSLSALHVMFKADTKEEREEMRRYHEAFKSPESTMSTKKMMGRTWFLLHCKPEKRSFYETGHHMRWDMFDPEDFPSDYRSRILFSRRHL